MLAIAGQRVTCRGDRSKVGGQKDLRAFGQTKASVNVTKPAQAIRTAESGDGPRMPILDITGAATHSESLMSHCL